MITGWPSQMICYSNKIPLLSSFSSMHHFIILTHVYGISCLMYNVCVPSRWILLLDLVGLVEWNAYSVIQKKYQQKLQKISKNYNYMLYISWGIIGYIFLILWM